MCENSEMPGKGQSSEKQYDDELPQENSIEERDAATLEEIQRIAEREQTDPTEVVRWWVKMDKACYTFAGPGARIWLLIEENGKTVMRIPYLL